MKKYILFLTLFFIPSVTNALTVSYTQVPNGVEGSPVSSFCVDDRADNGWPYYRIRAYYTDNGSLAGKNNQWESGCLPVNTFDSDREFVVLLSNNMEWRGVPEGGFGGNFSSDDVCNDSMTLSQCYNSLESQLSYFGSLHLRSYDPEVITTSYSASGAVASVIAVENPDFAFPVFYIALGGALISILIYGVIKYKA